MKYTQETVRWTDIKENTWVYTEYVLSGSSCSGGRHHGKELSQNPRLLEVRGQTSTSQETMSHRQSEAGDRRRSVGGQTLYELAPLKGFEQVLRRRSKSHGTHFCPQRWEPYLEDSDFLHTVLRGGMIAATADGCAAKSLSALLSHRNRVQFPHLGWAAHRHL